VPGRLAELAQVSARLRAGVTKEAGLLGAVGKAAAKRPLKTALLVGGTAMAGAAGVSQARATKAGFQPAIRDHRMGL
jgi:hypothetical protein